MPPGYRGSTRRQNRSGLIDHDVFEGLPVRHWRRDLVVVEPSMSRDNPNTQNDIWSIELPHGMPKASHLLPQHSQDLLRAARSGKIYKRPVAVEEEEIDLELTAGEKIEKKDEPEQELGFVTRAWKQVPRHIEDQDIDYLAKRRKCLKAVEKSASSGPTVTNTAKRIGNEVRPDKFAHGQYEEGECTSQSILPFSNACADNYTAQIPPLKRRGPFRKKFKGAGRGKKKKLLSSNIPISSKIENLPRLPAIDNIAQTSGTIEDTELCEDSLGNSDDGECDDADDNEEEEELVEDQEPLLSNTKSMSLSKPEEKTVTLIQPLLPVMIEMSALGSPLKNLIPNTSILTSHPESHIAKTRMSYADSQIENLQVNSSSSNDIVDPLVLQKSSEFHHGSMSLTTTKSTSSSTEARVDLGSGHENMLWDMTAGNSANHAENFEDKDAYLSQFGEQIHTNDVQPALNTMMEFSSHIFSNGHINTPSTFEKERKTFENMKEGEINLEFAQNQTAKLESREVPKFPEELGNNHSPIAYIKTSVTSGNNENIGS